MPKVTTEYFGMFLRNLNKNKLNFSLRQRGDDIVFDMETIGEARFDKWLRPIINPVYTTRNTQREKWLRQKRTKDIPTWEMDSVQAFRGLLQITNPPRSFYEDSVDSFQQTPYIYLPPQLRSDNLKEKISLIYCNGFQPDSKGHGPGEKAENSRGAFAVLCKDDILYICPSLSRKNTRDNTCEVIEEKIVGEPKRFEDNVYALCQSGLFIFDRETGASTKLETKIGKIDAFFLSQNTITLIDRSLLTATKIPLAQNALNVTPNSLTTIDIADIKGVTTANCPQVKNINVSQKSDEEPLLWQHVDTNGAKEMLFFNPALTYTHGFKTKCDNAIEVGTISNGNVTVYDILTDTASGQFHMLYTKDGEYIDNKKVPKGPLTESKATKLRADIFQKAAKYIKEVDPNTYFSLNEVENFPAVKELGLAISDADHLKPYTYYSPLNMIISKDPAKELPIVILNTELKKETKDGFKQIPLDSSEPVIGSLATIVNSRYYKSPALVVKEEGIKVYFEKSRISDDHGIAEVMINFKERITEVDAIQNTIAKMGAYDFAFERYDSKKSGSLGLITINDYPYLIKQGDGGYKALPITDFAAEQNPLLQYANIRYKFEKFIQNGDEELLVGICKVEDKPWCINIYDVNEERVKKTIDTGLTGASLPCIGVAETKDGRRYVTLDSSYPNPNTDTLFVIDIDTGEKYTHSRPHTTYSQHLRTSSYELSNYKFDSLIFSPSPKGALKFKDGKFEDIECRPDEIVISPLLPDSIILKNRIYNHETKETTAPVTPLVVSIVGVGSYAIIAHWDKQDPTLMDKMTVYSQTYGSEDVQKREFAPPVPIQSYRSTFTLKNLSIPTEDEKKPINVVYIAGTIKDSANNRYTVAIDLNGLMFPIKSKHDLTSLAFDNQVARCIDKLGIETYEKLSRMNLEKNQPDYPDFETMEDEDDVDDVLTMITEGERW